MQKIQVKIKLNESLGVTMPKYAIDGASGFDLVAAESVTVYPGSTALVDTGVAFEIPEGFEIQVRPRSGLSLKTNLRISNAPGTIDVGYSGYVKVIIDNKSSPDSPFSSPVHINKGDRIAQGVLCPVYQADFVLSNELSGTTRGSNGFGSTGI